MNWQSETLWEQLLPLAPGLSVEVLAATDSTNSTLLERAKRGDTAPCLLVAETQSAGRGRLGRSWWAAPGASLTFSLGLPYAPADWSGLSLAVGLAVAEALDPGNARIGLKWPNDLWLRGAAQLGGERKLGGILIETTALPGHPTSDSAHPSERYTVIGIGLNIASEPGHDDSLRSQFATGYAGLRELDATLDAPTVLHRVAPVLLRMLRVFQDAGLPPLRTRYQARDVLMGREVQAGETRGTAVGIDPQGQLLVQTAACLVPIGSGEVSVRPC